MNDDTNIRNGVFDEVRAEREAQDAQWGGPEHDDNHSPGDFAGFIDVQLIKCDWGNGPGCRERFIKVAAQPIDMDAPGFAPDELAMIRQHRIGRAKLALENIGIQIAQPFGMPAASESVSADSAA